MSKAVLISILPKWCELIASGEKTIEVRKTRPKQEPPFKCYIYCTKSSSAEKLLFLDFYGGTPKPGWVFPINRDTALRMGMAPMNGMVIGEFVCDKTEVYDYEYCTHPEIGMDYDCGDNWFCIDDIALKNACMSYEELRAYAGNKDVYGLHISNLVIYDEPKQLSEFMKPCDPDPDGVPLCLQCKRLGENWCGGIILRPPQSWCYVEELP